MGKTKKIKSPEELNYQLYFGEQLKRLLKKVGVTQLEFAQELNISKNTVCQWIHGLAAPEPLLFRKVVQFFLSHQIPDFNIYDLFMIDEPNITPQTLTLVEAGYRKADEVRKETAKEILDLLIRYDDGDSNSEAIELIIDHYGLKEYIERSIK